MKSNCKYIVCLWLISICCHLFAYNGGYENSLMEDTEIGGVVYKGYGNNTLTKRSESGTTIASSMYAQCKALKSVDLTGVTSIGDAAFAYSALESVTIPASVTSLGYIAFGGCTNLTTVTVKSWDWVAEGKEPFRDAAVTTLTVPGGVPPGASVDSLFPVLTTVRCPSGAVAEWKAKGYKVYDTSKTYVIQYNKNDGTGSVAEYIMNSGEAKNLAYQSSGLKWQREGYKFLGWAKQPTYGVSYVNGQAVTDLASAGKIYKLYAVWESQSNTYSIKYWKNDGTSDSVGLVYRRDIPQALATQGAQLGWQRAGYKFLGWAKQPTYGVSYVNAQKVTNLADAGKTMNLYAVWALSSESYTIKYWRNDGTDTSIGLVYKSGVTQTLATQSSQLGWTVSGKKFLGWAKYADWGVSYVNAQKIKDLASAGKTVNLYAVWQDASSSYTIKFFKNDGTTTSAGFVYAADVERALVTQSSQLGWTFDGYSFLGWSTDPSATVATYTNGQKVTNLAAAGKTVNLYAVWKKKTEKSVLAQPKRNGRIVENEPDTMLYHGALVSGEGVYWLLLDSARTTGCIYIEFVDGSDYVGDVDVVFADAVIVVTTDDGEVWGLQH